MKKIISAIVLCLMLAGSVLMLVSCGDIDEGKYVSSTGISFEIDGDTYIISDGDVAGYAKYKVDGDKLILTYDKIEFIGDSADKAEFDSNRDVLIEYFKANVCRTYDFEKIDGGVKIDGVKFKKQ